MPIPDFVPPETGDWRRAAEVRTFDRETIFDYIDGAGEVYRLYDFREVAVLEYRMPGAEPIVVEVFDMGAAGDAYGIFTFYHDGKHVEVGRGGYLKPGLLCFWQDKYFCCLSTSPDGESTDSALQTLARAIAGKMPDAGDAPAWVRYLPTNGLRPQSVRYFHNQPSLNYHYFVSEKNVLHLTQRTACALGWYKAGADSFVQVWVRYPDSTAAQLARASLGREYLAVTDDIARRRDGRWTAVATRGRFLAVALEMPSRQVADSVRQTMVKTLDEVTDD